MRIGILTYHKAHNYGALLQAIALRGALQKMGNEVFYIDYWPKYHSSKYKLFSFLQFRLGLHRYLLHRLYNLRPILKRIKSFKQDIVYYIEPYCEKNGKYDAIIYGSDQIWRRQSETGRYNPIYFGNNNFVAKRHISYAASMGMISPSEEEKTNIKGWLSHLDAIGVREPDLQNLLKELEIPSQLNVDPTLLVNADDWDKILGTKRIVEGKYLFYYNLNEDTFNREAIEQYAKNKGLRIIEVYGNAHKEKKDSYSAIGIRDFVSYIKFADIVFSTSYHGMVFSLIYKKKVYVSFRSNSQRAKSLLDFLNIGGCFIQPHAEVYPEICIDYDDVKKRLSKLAEESLDYLMINLKH